MFAKYEHHWLLQLPSMFGRRARITRGTGFQNHVNGGLDEALEMGGALKCLRGSTNLFARKLTG